jgi:hypothetical protein
MSILERSPKPSNLVQLINLRQAALSLILFGMLLSAGSASGAPQVWAGGTGAWSTDINWTPNTWVPSNTAVFDNTPGTVTVGTQTAGGLTFNVGGYTLASGTLTMDTGSVITTSGGTTTLPSSLSLAGAAGCPFPRLEQVRSR